MRRGCLVLWKQAVGVLGALPGNAEPRENLGARTKEQTIVDDIVMGDAIGHLTRKDNWRPVEESRNSLIFKNPDPHRRFQPTRCLLQPSKWFLRSINDNTLTQVTEQQV